jgi:two-component system response regulator HydG
MPRSTDTSALLGRSRAMAEVRRLVAAAADTDLIVLLTGESGTGKTAAAARIHGLSGRTSGPFVQTNCAGLAETLLDSELFGHEPGSFTGADRRHIGKFEQAAGGTLLLDEIGDLSPQAQAKLLDVIERKALMRVGGEELVHVDVRLIAATNRDLEQRARSGRFRDDLYYRLSELTIRMPPLRERPEDIPELVQHFVGELSAEQGRHIERVSDAAMAQLRLYDWPGNVRELRNVLKRGIAAARHDAVWIEDLPLRLEMQADVEPDGGLLSLEEVERRHIEQVLERLGWKKVDAARVLGITRATLDRKIDKYDLQKPE